MLQNPAGEQMRVEEPAQPPLPLTIPERGSKKTVAAFLMRIMLCPGVSNLWSECIYTRR